MKLFQRVLVAVGDVNEEGDLLRYARVLRDISCGAEFYFVHVLGWPSPQSFRQEPLTHAEAVRRLEESVAAHCGADYRARCLVRHGNAVDCLLECAAELMADLILVGHAREHRGRRSIARRLAMQAPCSVWMRPRNSRSSISQVWAAIDYSEPASYALSVASQIARLAGSSDCIGLRVYRHEASAGSQEHPLLVREREAFERFTAPLDTAGLEVRPVLEEGASVVHVVNRLASARNIDLVVMGSRGQSRSASTLLGSESEDVLMESKVPVLIAKRRGERIGLLQALLDRDFGYGRPQFG